MANIKTLLGEKFCELNAINSKAEYIIEWRNPIDFLVSNRFDIIAKLIYAEAMGKRTGGVDWAEKLYRKQTYAISGGKEWNNSQKNKVDDYVDSFQRLREHIINVGFDAEKSAIPVGDKDVILDGAHRVALGICLGKQVPTIRINGATADYGFNFFNERMLDEKYADYMALEYQKRKSTAYAVCIWPRVGKSKLLGEMEVLFKENADIVYKKRIELNYTGLCNLMVQIYRKYEWIGNVDNGFDGVIGQADPCYSPNSPMYYYILDVDSLERLKSLKRKVRNLFQVGNYSMHSADNQEESILIGRMLLNNNSIDFLNTAHPFKNKIFYSNIEEFSESIFNSQYDKFAIGGSGTLAIYGENNINSITIFTTNNMISGKMNEIQIKIDDNIKNEKLLQNPEYYFYYGSIKYLTAAALVKFSLISPKDKALVRSIEKSGKRDNKLIMVKREVQRRYKTKKRQMKAYFINILEKRGLLESVLNFYHKYRRK